MKKLSALSLSLLVGCFAFAQKTFTEPKRIVEGHTNDVNQVTVSSKGDYIATGSWDKNINVYDSSYKMITTLHGHTFPVTTLRFRWDGKMLASGSSDNTIIIWDSTFKKVKTLEGHKDQVNSVLFDKSNRYVFSGSEDHMLMAWDIASGKSFRKIDAVQPITSIAQTNDPRYIYAAAGPQIKIYTLANSLLFKTLDGHADVVNAIATSSNNQLLISGSNDKTARIWDLKAGKQIRVLPVDCWKVTAVAFSDDSKYAITGCNDGSVKVWEVETGKLISSIEGKGNYVKDVAFTKNKMNVLVASMLRGSTDFGLRVWPSAIETMIPKPIVPAGIDSLKTQNDSIKKKPLVAPKKNPAPVKK
jgi:WD40 repeat protein